MSPSKLYIVNLLFSFIPATRMFGVKRLLLRWAGVKVGNNVRVVSSVRVLGVGELTIGENTFIGYFTKILVDGARLGDCSIIASGATVVSEVPSYCLFGGVPAKFLKKYKETNYL